MIKFFVVCIDVEVEFSSSALILYGNNAGMKRSNSWNYWEENQNDKKILSERSEFSQPAEILIVIVLLLVSFSLFVINM